MADGIMSRDLLKRHAIGLYIPWVDFSRRIGGVWCLLATKMTAL